MNLEIKKSGKNFQAWDKSQLNSVGFWALSSNEDRFYYLASLAHLAANSHNTQPWKFSYQKEFDCLQIFIETARVLPASDFKGRQATLSVGCAMGNLEVAAQALGCELSKKIIVSDSEVITHSVNAILVAEYRLEKAAHFEIDEDILKMYNAIFTRRVDRGEYDHDRKIEPTLLKKIENLGTNNQVKTILIADWGRKVALAELQCQADSFVINNKEFANEFINEWMLENSSEQGLGMPGDTFRLNAEQTSKIKFRFKNNLGFESDDASSIAQLGKKGILSCQCVGLLTIEKDVPSEWLNAGIVLEKGALLFEANGIAWAVHAGLAEVSQINMLMLRPIAMTSKRPVVLFRAGYLKYNEVRSPHSPRMQFETVWCN